MTTIHYCIHPLANTLSLSYDVEEGSYILSVISHDYLFDTVSHNDSSLSKPLRLEQLRIDVRSDPKSQLQVRPYVAGTPHNPPSTVVLPYPITLTPRLKNVYFVEAEAFNLLAMLKNPMILMMVVTGGLVMAMPYIMVNVHLESYNIRYKNTGYRLSNKCLFLAEKHGPRAGLRSCRKTSKIREHSECYADGGFPIRVSPSLCLL